MNKDSCKVCGNAAGNKTYTIKEMMFGLREEFEYLECAQCNCLQLKEIPSDISKYYPEDYYSYFSKGEDHHIQTSISKRLKRKGKKELLDYYLSGNRVVGSLLGRKLNEYYPWIKKSMLTSRSHILDVGCGSGELLLKMYNDGFKNLKGLDPYIKDDIHYKCGITIQKKPLSELTGSFDLIMMHHAFEHMDEPLSVVKKMFQQLNPGGILLIRIPVADCFAWKKYQANWVQIDAPRHFFLHTRKSMKILADQSGFILDSVVFDSWNLQFYGSELYLKGLPLSTGTKAFSDNELTSFTLESKRLNELNEGDQACFYLVKPK